MKRQLEIIKDLNGCQSEVEKANNNYSFTVNNRQTLGQKFPIAEFEKVFNGLQMDEQLEIRVFLESHIENNSQILYAECVFDVTDIAGDPPRAVLSRAFSYLKKDISKQIWVPKYSETDLDFQEVWKTAGVF